MEIPGQLHPSIVQRSEVALDHFEVSHPDLTVLISKVLESVTKAGI